MEKDKVLNPTNAQRKERAEAAIAESEKLLAEAKAAKKEGKTLTWPQQKVSKAASREPQPSANFAMVVCRHPDKKRFLLVQETNEKHFKWWLPGGRVEWGDSFETTAIKETFEEGGIDVVLKGLIRFERTPLRIYARQRMFFYAEPKDDPPPEIPKDWSDRESNAAKWVTLEEMESLPLRGAEPLEYCGYIANGGPIYPLSILDFEGSVLRIPGKKEAKETKNKSKK